MWLDLLENPQAISTLFGSAPSLDGVEIISTKLDRDGPTVDLSVALNEYPAHIPTKWRSLEADAVVLVLQLMALESLHIEGWSTTNRANISIVRRSGSQLELLATADAFRMSCIFGFLRVAGISPYVRVSPGKEEFR